MKSRPRDYARILGAHVKLSFVLSLQYRVEFLLNLVLAAFWCATAIIPLFILFETRETFAGWGRDEALLVVGFFTLLKGILEGTIQPSLQNVIEHIRKGTFDFVLIKPFDAQFLVSTLRFEVWRMGSVVSGVGLIVYAASRSAHPVPPRAVAIAGVLLLSAIVTLYSIWTFVISLAFRVVKVDNLSYLFLTLYDVARWPSSVFKGALSFLFTFVLPFALMTTYPALAILGRLPAGMGMSALVIAAVFAVTSRVVWLASVRHYTSAGG